MKKFLLILSAAALLLTGCAKEKFNSGTEGGIVNATFTAQIQGNSVTRAVADNDGFGKNITRCILELYYGDELYVRKVADAADITAPDGNGGNGTVKFNNIQLVSNRTYNVLCWADAGEGYYKADALTSVEMKAVAYTANDDKRDAFFYSGSQEVAQQGETYNITLARPFAQVNVITTDASVIKFSSLYPENVKMVYTAPTKFNLLSKELGEEEELTVTGNSYASFNASSAELTLGMDYLFAGTDKSALDIKFEASKTGETTVKHDFTNIPVQRNYRTNIKGALLTTVGNWTATIVPIWNQPDEEVKFVEAGSVAAANEAFAKGATSVKITSVGDETNLYLPQTTEEVTIDFANPDKVVTVKYGPATAPATKAAVEGVKPSVVNISTNDVTKFTVTSISNIVWLAGNQTALASALNNAVAGQTVALANDITMSGNWTSCELNADFNGNGHVIMGMKNTSCAPDYAGLFKVSYSNIKNVTIQGAEFVYGTETMSARGGILVGDMRRGSIENCHVVGAKFTGYQKVGGLVGFISANADNNTDISIKNCSVTNATFAACGANDGTDDDDYLYQAGGLVGYIALGNRNISISNCSVENITYDNTKFSGVYNKPNTNNGFLSHTFVGAIFSQTNNAANTLAFTANTISGENTQLNANMYGSAYFGWARNPEYKPSETVTLGKITIDGVEWTPNYPVKIVGGKGYATLNEALTAATAGQTVQILKAGEYTFPGNTKKAVTVEGLNEKDADGNYVVAINLNGVSEYNENLTFKHMTFNFTNSEGADRGFTHCVNMTYNECTFTGLMWGYDSQVSTFNDCLFHQATKYNVWSYGGNLEFNRCLFQTSTGTIVNVYATGTDIHEVRFNDCTFESLTDVLDKGAILLKGGKNHGHVIVNNYTLKGKFQNNGDFAKYINSADGLYMFSLRDGDFSDAVYITVNGVTHYPYFTIDANGDYHVNSVAGLRTAIEHYNKLSTTGEFKIFVANGTYEVSDMFVMQHKDLSLTIKAEEKGKAIFKLNDDTKTKIFFLLDNPTGDLNFGTEYFTVDGINFQIPSNPTIELGKTDVYVIYGVTANSDPYVSVIRPGYTPKRYMHNINMLNCKVEGFGTQNLSVIYSSENFQRILVKNCDIASVGYVTNGNGDDISLINTKVSGTKTCLNCNDPHGKIIVEGCNISTYHDCCLRAGQNAVIKNNTFNITYSGTATDAAVIYFRGATGPFEATITGNTFNKSADTKYDVFVKSNSGPWTINKGEAYETVIEKGKGVENIRQQ